MCKADYAVYLRERDIELFRYVALYFQRKIAVYFLGLMEYRNEGALSVLVLSDYSIQFFRFSFASAHMVQCCSCKTPFVLW